MGQHTENQRQSMEGFLQDLLFLVEAKEQRDLIVELLLAMQQPSEPSRQAAGWQRLHETRFEIFKMSASGNVSVGAIRGIDQAQKVLVCLNTTENSLYFLRDANSGKVVGVSQPYPERNDFPAYLN
jgi:hypothetical protein